jgi:hypothetical protein
MITEELEKCRWVAADMMELSSPGVNPENSRGMRLPGK